MPSPAKDKTLTIPHVPTERHQEFTRAFKDSGLDRAQFLELMFNKAHDYDNNNAEKDDLIERVRKVNENLIAENKYYKKLYHDKAEQYDILVQDLKDLGKWPVKG